MQQGKLRSSLRPAPPKGPAPKQPPTAGDSSDALATVVNTTDTTGNNTLAVRPSHVPFAQLFPHAPTASLEPKVFVPYKHVRGQIPRKIEVERKRRLYETQDVTELVRIAGLTFQGIGESDATLPLQIFDDTNFDCRTPGEWMALAREEGHTDPFLPARALRHNRAEKTYSYELCRVVDWDEDRNEVRVLWGVQGPGKNSAVQKEESSHLPRLYVLLLAEDPACYVQRIAHAHTQREKVWAWQRYYLTIDCMPTDTLPGLTDSTVDYIVKGTKIKSLSEAEFPEVKSKIEKVLGEMSLEWRRTHNQILLESKVARNPDVGELLKLSTGLQMAEIHADRAKAWRPRDSQLSVAMSESQFKAKNESFNFHTYYTQAEVIGALTSVRAECMNILSDPHLASLFVIPDRRCMSLQDFEKIQIDQMDKMSSYLKNDWRDKLRCAIQTHLHPVGKGWLNVHEANKEIYEISKLKRLFTTVKYIMEDTVHFLVQRSLETFTDFIEKVSDFQIKVVDMATVNVSYPGSDAPDAIEKQPLFTLSLEEKDGLFSYSTPLDRFEEIIIELFDRAITATHDVPQVERYVMEQYFWHSESKGPFLDMVQLQDSMVVDLRKRVRTAISVSLQPLALYLRTYDEMLNIVKLNRNDYIAEFEKEEHTTEEMSQEIKKHLRGKKSMLMKIPYHVWVGNFTVDCHHFRYTMSNKNQDLAKAVMDLINKIAKKKVQVIRDEFTKISNAVQKKNPSVEKLYETKGVITNLPEQLSVLHQDIEDMKVYYVILEGFQCGLSDEDFRGKWEAIGWPRKMDGILEKTLKLLEGEGEKFHEIMVADAVIFDKEVERLKRIVAAFNKNQDLSLVAEVASQVKLLNKQIKECQEKAKELNDKQRLFEDELTDYTGVMTLAKEFKPFSDFWSTANIWTESHKKWHTDPFDTIDPEDLESIVTSCSKTMLGLTKTFKDKPALLKLVDEVKKQTDDFKPVVPVAIALRNPGMKDRHWETLSKQLNVSLVPGESLNTLKDCYGLIPHKDIIVRNCEVAAKEYQIEKALKDMKAKWQDKNFNFSEWKLTKTFVLRETGEINELLDDNINITQQLSFSPFKAQFAEEIENWERDLNLVAEIVDQWMECQRAWLYLEPIFSSEDIAVQLPKLSKLFEKVDRTWRKIMTMAKTSPNVMTFCTTSSKVLDQLTDANKNLETVQKGLNDYLADKRQAFARFYFLSDEELLEILSTTKDPRNIDRNIGKLFEFFHHLEWTDGDNGMISFTSHEGERIPHTKKVMPKGNVESWLSDLEREMKASLNAQMKMCVEDNDVTPRRNWVTAWPGQIILSASPIFWTKGCEDTLTAGEPLSKFSETLHGQLMELVEVVQSPLGKVERINMGALITIEVHAKDTIDIMHAANVTDLRGFDWIKQLRMYFEDGMCHIRQVDGHFLYGGEYLGNTGRLVVTPLTDRIYLTLTGALALNLGGAPAGPAGTGKTETTKDLAKALAKQCVVFNCQEGMNYRAMAKMFKGLAWSGAWACFDEFNRIDVEVLSVVAQQVSDLQQACITKQYRLENFEGSEVVVDPTYAIFITMNPGYAGRTELPDNLKVLFRPVACMVPDYALIGEIRLFSYGYKQARSLAKKMVLTFKLSSEQLSAQDHYDFGMRAVNTVISAAGLNKRDNPNEVEDILLLRALRDSNIPKFLKDDIVLFEGIISDLFPGLKLPEADLGILVEGLKESTIETGYQPLDTFLIKCIQLYDITILRHGLMLVGPTGGGKTSNYRVLQKAMTAITTKQAKGLHLDAKRLQKVTTHICNPKAITMNQLYGAYDMITQEWCDGVLCILFRRAAKAEDMPPHKQWVIFDGPVDALWIESMNTVLDENKKLCLVSGEIIQMSKEMTMMFEVEDLSVASPATVSRCGMIYMDPDFCVPTLSRITSWVQALPKHWKKFEAELAALCVAYIDPLISFVRRNLKEYVMTVDNNLVHSLFNIMDAFIAQFAPVPATAEFTQDRYDIAKRCNKPLFLLSVVWSIGASCDGNGRNEFDKMFREVVAKNNDTTHFPAEGSCYDYMYRFAPNPEDEVESKWVGWMDTRAPFQLRARTKFNDVIIPTIDTIRQNFFLEHLIGARMHVAAMGPTGTGKTVAMSDAIMKALPEKYGEKFQGIFVTFSAQTHANKLQDSLLSKMEVRNRRQNIVGPQAGKHFIVFVDDTNLPQKEVYGAQPPIEVLRQYLGHSGVYSFLPPIKFNTIIDMSLTVAMGPPSGGRNPISNRFLRYFNFIAFPELSDTAIETIFTTMLATAFTANKFDAQIMELLPLMVRSTITVFEKCCKVFVPTPAHVHYTFNLRDISRIFVMLYDVEAKVIKSPLSLLRLWIHEASRVFRDRLIDKTDRGTFEGFLDEELKTKFGYEKGLEEVVPGEFLVWGDYMIAGADPRIYNEVVSNDALLNRINEGLNSYNEDVQPQLPLVMFQDALEHVSRLCRVLRLPNGHALMLGIGGSGRKSLCRLACFFMEGMEMYSMEISRNFTLREWREAIAKLLLSVGKEDKKVVFLFADTQIVKPIFLEDVASLLTSGDIPNLFEDKDIESINDHYKAICLSENLPTTKLSMYARFIKEVRANLHIVLAFSPIGAPFRDRMRMFPALVNCCTIDWYSEWPQEALQGVARDSFEKNNVVFSDELQLNVIEMFTTMHLTAAQTVERFFNETKRRTYVTPTSYLALLETFFSLLAQKKKFVVSSRVRLENGLEKLRVTEDQVSVLKEMLKAKQPVLIQTQEEIKIMMAKLAIDKEAATEKQEAAQIEEKAATAQKDECSKIRKSCQDRLDEALPALDEALKCLKNLKAKDVSEVGKYASPPKGVVYCMTAVCIMLREPPTMEGPTGAKIANYWLPAKKILGDAKKLVDSFLNYDKDKMDEKLVAEIRPYVEDPEFTPLKMKSVAEPCMAMCQWVHAMYKFYFVNKEVKPLRALLEQSEAELEIVTASLKETRAKLKMVEDSIAELEAKYEAALKKQKELSDEVVQTEKKLIRAGRLIDGLGGEKVRWKMLAEQYGAAEQTIVGDMLLAAGTIAYFGPFTASYRKDLLASWEKSEITLNIPRSEECDPISTCGNPVEIQTWQLQGLPTDALSTQNALILKKARSWPLLIDPQGQADVWVRNSHKDEMLVSTKISDADFSKKLEGAIRMGLPCILGGIQEDLDPLLDPVLLKQTYLRGSTPHIKIGETEIAYDPNFKLYMTTKLPNPMYTPETIVKVCLLNFFITPGGLEDQLLGVTVGKERKDLEDMKQALTRSNADKMKELKALQDDILRLLQEAQGDILEQEDLINILEASKKKSTEINAEVAKAKILEKDIDETREKYRPHAFRGAVLFFCCSGLAIVDPMYQFSLAWFMNLFIAGIEKSETNDDVPTRIDNLMQYFTYSFYSNVCRSLFEKHKLIFSFVLCLSIIKEEGKIDADEFRFLLAGATSSVDGGIPNPAPKWMTVQTWNDVQFVAKALPNFENYDVHVRDHIEVYQGLFDNFDAHKHPLEASWQERVSPLQRLVITRVFRPDKVTHGIQVFVTTFIGEKFVVVPQFSLLDAYKDSEPQTPLIFILSSGADPMSELLKFAEQMKMAKKLDKVSLGQGQGPKAAEMLREGVERGTWVLLQNCHLAKSWMPELEKIVEGFKPEQMKKDFRLWLTSMPSAAFPVAILQIGVKMTNEPPKGLRANMTRAFFSIKEDDLIHPSKPDEYKKLFFAECFFHAVIQERRRFGALGFNIPYEFSDSDRAVCVSQLRKFLEAYEVVPFDVLTFLSGEINYGGRVTDDWDRRTMMTWIQDYLSPKVLTEGYFFSPSGVYTTLTPANRLSYMETFNTWPLNAAPEVFGLHDNADITCARNETTAVFETVLSMQSGGGGGGGKSRDQIMMAVAAEMRAKVPPPFSIFDFAQKYPTSYNECMNTVLTQEAVRYTKLLTKMANSLRDFGKAIKGEDVMSGELEAMGNSMYMNAVPKMWADLAYPSLMPLSSWVNDLVKRVEFINDWFLHGVPKTFWICGFFFPQAFLTGTLQNYARRTKVAIDRVSFSFRFMKETIDTIKVAPEHGAIIWGMYMEGARWDSNEYSIVESRPKELFTELPAVALETVLDKQPPKGVYLSPVYKTLERKGTLSTTGHSTNFVLPIEIPTKKPANHWIKRGVACVLTLDF